MLHGLTFESVNLYRRLGRLLHPALTLKPQVTLMVMFCMLLTLNGTPKLHSFLETGDLNTVCKYSYYFQVGLLQHGVQGLPWKLVQKLETMQKGKREGAHS